MAASNEGLCENIKRSRDEFFKASLCYRSFRDTAGGAATPCGRVCVLLFLFRLCIPSSGSLNESTKKNSGIRNVKAPFPGFNLFIIKLRKLCTKCSFRIPLHGGGIFFIEVFRNSFMHRYNGLRQHLNQDEVLILTRPLQNFDCCFQVIRKKKCTDQPFLPEN